MYFKTPYPNQREDQASLYAVPYDPLDRHTHPDISLSMPYLLPLSQPSDSYAANVLDEGHEDATSALDAITDHLTTNTSSDPLGAFLTGKKRFLAKSVEDLLGLLYEREQIKYDSLRKIDYDSAQIKARLFEIDSWRTGINPQIDKTRANIERELLAFEREKRFEEVACWRDTTRLKSELREVLREFDSEKRREAVLGGYEV